MEHSENDTIASGHLSFPAKPEMIKSLIFVAKQLGLDYKDLARTMVEEQLRLPLDDVDYIAKNEERAYKEVRHYLGVSITLVQIILELYNHLSEHFGNARNSLTPHQIAAFLPCFQACRYNAILASLVTLRAHPIDAANYRRKSIEFCAFVIKIMRSADHAETWFKATSNTAYEKYKKAFEIMATITEGSDLMGSSMKKTYNTLCQQVHASPYAIVTQISTDNGMHNLHYFQHQNEEHRKLLALTFFSGLKTDFTVVNALGLLVKETTENFDSKIWTEKTAYFEQEYEKVKAAWAGELDPTGAFKRGEKSKSAKKTGI